MQNMQSMQNKPTRPNLENQSYKTKPNLPNQSYKTKPNLPNQTYQTKPTKPNLPNQTYQTKPTKPNLPNQTYLTKPTKPKLLVKAVNAWVRSAFGNVLPISLRFVTNIRCRYFSLNIWVVYEQLELD